MNELVDLIGIVMVIGFIIVYVCLFVYGVVWLSNILIKKMRKENE